MRVAARGFSRLTSSRRWLHAGLMAALLMVALLAVGIAEAAPPSGSWIVTGSMSNARGGHTATLLHNGQVLVAGGNGDSTTSPSTLNSAELYDPKAGLWSPTGSMSTARTGHTATLLHDGRVLVAGGSSTADTFAAPPLASAELYDPKTGTWSPTGSMSVGRNGHTAVLLHDGRVLVAGGFGGNTGSFLSSAELYDPKIGTWTATGSMSTGRRGHTATLLNGGQVLVAGGRFAAARVQVLDSAELYDPKTGNWSPTGSMSGQRVNHTATLLHGGEVLVAGGFEGGIASFLNTAELYDPKAGAWRTTGSMNAGRDVHTATLLHGGEVLVAGGESTVNPPRPITLASAELYDPKTRSWSPTDSMSTPRAGHTATLLRDGSVLVAGGSNDSGSFLASAELIRPKD